LPPTFRHLYLGIHNGKLNSSNYFIAVPLGRIEITQLYQGISTVLGNLIMNGGIRKAEVQG